MVDVWKLRPDRSSFLLNVTSWLSYWVTGPLLDLVPPPRQTSPLYHAPVERVTCSLM